MLYSVEGRESGRVGGGVDVENALLSGGERKWKGGRRSRRRECFTQWRGEKVKGWEEEST